MSNEERPNPVPEHLGTVTPRLVVDDGAAAIAFYERAFGATEVAAPFLGRDGEIVHAEIRIGDSVVMITEDADPDAPARSPRAAGTVTTVLATYWPDADAAWARALDAGAEVIYPIGDRFYGERGGRVRDPFGHQWMISSRIERVTPEEMASRAAGFPGEE